MGVMYPLAVVTTASITSLVRMTRYHHSISVGHARVEMDEDMAVLGGQDWLQAEQELKNQQNWLQAGREMRNQDPAGDPVTD